MARDLTALADGTLRPERREPLLRRVSASPQLARALKQQLIAIEAIRRLDTPAPTELRERIQRAIRDRSRFGHATRMSPSAWALRREDAVRIACLVSARWGAQAPAQC